MHFKFNPAWFGCFIGCVFALHIVPATGISAEIEGFGFLGLKLGQAMDEASLEGSKGDDLAEIHLAPQNDRQGLPRINEYTAYVDRKTKTVAKLEASTAHIGIEDAEALFRGIAEAISKEYGPMIPLPIDRTGEKISRRPSAQVLRTVHSGRSITLTLEPFYGRTIKVPGLPEPPRPITSGLVTLVYAQHGEPFQDIPKIEISPEDI